MGVPLMVVQAHSTSTSQDRHKEMSISEDLMFQHLLDKKKFIVVFCIALTTSLLSQEFLAGYTVQGTRTQVIMPLDITLTNNWDIYKSEDKRYPQDTLFTKNKSVYARLGFSALTYGTASSYIDDMVSYGYTKHIINNQVVITQKTQTPDGSNYYNVRMAFDKPKKIFLFIPMYPYDDFKNSSLEDELKQLVSILSSIKIHTIPNSKNNVAVKNAEELKYANIRKEIDDGLATATLIDDEGKLETVDSYCMGLQTIPFKYSQDKTAPQWIKDYANNAITQCKGKLYTGALTKHLKKEGKTSCASLKQAFADDYSIKGALRDTGESKMWDTLQSNYAKVCK